MLKTAMIIMLIMLIVLNDDDDDDDAFDECGHRAKGDKENILATKS